jgi:hypothetical protein
MDSLILGFSFAAAVAISACVVSLFSRSIDESLVRVVPQELFPSWSRFVKFALFTVTLVGGMRLSDLAVFIMQRAPTGPPISAGEALLEVFKTITGSLVAASVLLLAFFVAALAIDASMRVFWLRREASEKAAAHKPRPAERPSSVSERQPVGSERHAGGKDRQRTEGSGRFL